MTPYLQRPLIPLSLAALAGCLLGGLGSGLPPWSWIGFGLACVALAWLGRSQTWGTWVLLLVLSAGFASWAQWKGQEPVDSIGHWAPRRVISLQGKLSQLLTQDPEGRFVRGVLEVERVLAGGNTHAASGAIQFTLNLGRPAPARGTHLDPGWPAWNPGDRLQMTGRLEPWPASMNPGERESRRGHALQGNWAQLTLSRVAPVIRVRSASVLSFGWITGETHRWLKRHLLAASRGPGQGLLLGLVLGDTGQLQYAQREEMASAGLAHLLAVSGFNVGLIFGLFFWPLRWLRCDQRLAQALALAAVGWFTLATGAEVPVLRASLMALCLTLPWWFHRPSDPASGLSLAALVLLSVDPLSAFSLGFQLSFAATAALIAWSEQWPQAWSPRAWFGSWTLGALGVSSAAFIGTWPLMVSDFFAFSPWSILLNLVAIPLASVAAILGLVSAGLQSLWAGLGQGVGWLAQMASQGVEGIATFANGLPGGRIFAWPGPGWWVAGAYVLLLAQWLWPRTRKLLWLGLLAWVLGWFAFRPAGPNPTETRITFLSLNSGEATLVESGLGLRLLLDTGTPVEFALRVKPFLASRGINRLDALVLSHGDADHAGGAEACLRAFRVRSLLLTPELAAAPLGQSMSALARQRGAKVEREARGQELAWGPIRLQVLWPPLAGAGAHNLQSLVGKLSFPGGSLGFAGDSPQAVEEASGLSGPLTVLKASHHGSRTSSSSRFLQRCRPELSVVMPGNRNPYSFPQPEAWERLKRYSGRVLSTQKEGAIQVSVGADGRWQAKSFVSGQK